MTRANSADENKLAQEIISVLPAEAVARLVCEDGDTIRFNVEGMKLRTIILSRSSLRKLCFDPARAVKVEYLQRDLLRSAKRRAEFRYPRLNFGVRRRSRRFSITWADETSAAAV